MKALHSKERPGYKTETTNLANSMHLGDYQVTRTAVLNHVAPFVPSMMMPHICHYSENYEAQKRIYNAEPEKLKQSYSTLE
jgi:hypothetical protein